MKIYETSVRKPVSVILIFVGAVVLGLFSLNRLSIDLYPEMEIPMLSVITTYVGASAEDIEQNITRRVEDNLNTVQDLKKISSQSRENMSVVTLEFEWGSNLDEASNDVRDAIGRIESYLPDAAEKPTIIKFSTSMMPIMMLTANAKESYAGLDKLLEEKVANPLNRIDGVGAVNISGAPVREVQVNVDPRKMEAYHLTVEHLGQIIAGENRNIPAGSMDIGSERIALRINGEFSESRQIKDIVVANVGGKEIKISDIASVKDTIRKMTQRESVNGQLAVQMSIQKQSGANTVNICRAVRKALPALQKTLPPDVQLDIFWDSSEYISNSINSLTETVYFAFLFVIIVVLVFLGRWRATIIIALSIPISLLTAFIYLMVSGGTLNMISLSSLAIAIGMVVDDAIVVLENITKHLERKARPNDAAIYGTNEVWVSVIAATLTIIAVFLPLTLVGGFAGIMFKQLGWIVTIVITTSVVVAVTLTPMLSAKMLRFQMTHTYKGIGVIYKPIDAFLIWLDNAYARLLRWVVAHKRIMVTAAVLVFVSSLVLLKYVPSDFMPDSDNGQVEATLDLPVNYNLDQTSELAHRLEKIFRDSVPEMVYMSVSSGASDEGGFAALFGNSGLNQVSYSVILTKSTQRKRTHKEVADVMRRIVERVPEVEKSKFGGNNMGMGGGSTVDIKIFGYDFDVTNRLAADLQAKMKTIAGARDVTLSREKMKVEMRVEFNREKLAKFGINTSTAGTYVRNRINGLTSSLYREDGEEYDIVVRYDEPYRTSVTDIQQILLYNNAGQAIPLSEVANVVERFTPPIIEREDRQRVITVSAALAPGAALSTVADAAREKIAELGALPAGVTIDTAGAVEDQAESFRDLLTLMLLIILLVYIVMAAQFESFGLPLIIMVSILFAFTGVFLALFITQTPLNMIALIGAIMLVGIVVKNGIVIVDFTNLQRERGLPLREAVIVAGKSRLRPVLMTTLTTILGMMPVAIGTGEGSELWKPMGVAIIGGLSFSTVLTLLIVPAMYTAFNFGKGKKVRKANRVEVN